jgi:hypothetical protein
MSETGRYIPILRWKGAEMAALRLLGEERQKITPLVEITPKAFRPKVQESGDDETASPSLIARESPVGESQPNPSEVLTKQTREMLRCWGNAPFYLDLGHIDGIVPPLVNACHPFTFTANLARNYKLSVTPVTSLNRTNEYQNSVAEIMESDLRGACIRVTAEEVLNGSFNQGLGGLLSTLRARVQELDLLIDFGGSVEKMSSLAALISSIPELSRWRSLIVAGGAFPKDLQQLQLGSNIIPRTDWLNLRMAMNDSRIERKIIVADYTIQCGEYREPVEHCNPSASIRYTLEESWLVMRGEGIFNKDGPGTAQWPANAMLLCDRSDFYGAPYSYGDKYIFEMSRDRKKNGTAMSWLRAGINHHLTVMSNQIAGL